MFFTSLKEHFVDAISAGVREVERKMEDAKAHIRGRDEDSFTEKAEKFMRLVNHSSHDVRIAACQDLARSAVFAKRSQVEDFVNKALTRDDTKVMQFYALRDLSGALGNDFATSFALPRIVTLGRDANWHVRAVVAEGLGVMARYVSPAAIDSSMLPLFDDLVRDSEKVPRELCIKSLGGLADRGDDGRMQRLLGLYFQLAEDDAHEVWSSVLVNTGVIVELWGKAPEPLCAAFFGSVLNQRLAPAIAEQKDEDLRRAMQSMLSVLRSMSPSARERWCEINEPLDALNATSDLRWLAAAALHLHHIARGLLGDWPAAPFCAVETASPPISLQQPADRNSFTIPDHTEPSATAALQESQASDKPAMLRQRADSLLLYDVAAASSDAAAVDAPADGAATNDGTDGEAEGTAADAMSTPSRAAVASSASSDQRFRHLDADQDNAACQSLCKLLRLCLEELPKGSAAHNTLLCNLPQTLCSLPPAMRDEWLGVLLETYASWTSQTASDSGYCLAYNFPAALYLIGTTKWAELRSMYDGMAKKGTIAMRLTLAHSISAVAQLLGDEVASEELLPIFSFMLWDQSSEIAEASSAHAIEFLATLNKEARAAFLADFVNTSGVWARRGRYKEYQAMQMPAACRLFATDNAESMLDFVVLALRLLHDRSAAVRTVSAKSAIEMLQVLCELSGYSDSTAIVQQIQAVRQANGALSTVLSAFKQLQDVLLGLAGGASFRERQVFVQLCAAAAESHPEMYLAMFEKPLLLLRDDVTNDVRVAVQRYLDSAVNRALTANVAGISQAAAASPATVEEPTTAPTQT